MGSVPFEHQLDPERFRLADGRQRLLDAGSRGQLHPKQLAILIVWVVNGGLQLGHVELETSCREDRFVIQDGFRFEARCALVPVELSRARIRIRSKRESRAELGSAIKEIS